MTPADRLAAYIHGLPPSVRLVGRLETGDGPTPILVRGGMVFDISANAPTVADLLANPRFAASIEGRSLGRWDALELAAAWQLERTPRLLSPVDLQCIKAAGVTFAASALERVTEERARGQADRAQAFRASLESRIGTSLAAVRPGSAAAAHLKDALIADGLWSQYLEVAIGPDAEIFTKAPILSSVGWGDAIGVRADSHWNNPEPEIVLVCGPAGHPVGATLGNDVNLRDIEGRSALLLGKAKDNNASCAIGPLIRLFDADFTLDHVRAAEVLLDIEGEDGFTLTGSSSMRLISRDPLELVAQTIGEHHAYPDGFALFLGTMFAPTQDRDAPGQGFTHHDGDRVRISCAPLGSLENRVTSCAAAPRWSFGVGALMRNLAARGLLGEPGADRRLST